MSEDTPPGAGAAHRAMVRRQDIDREEVQGIPGSNDGRYVRQPEPRGHAVCSMLAQSAIKAMALMGRG